MFKKQPTYATNNKRKNIKQQKTSIKKTVLQTSVQNGFQFLFHIISSQVDF